MQYNIDYLNLKYALVEAFMFNLSTDILDISYNRTDKKIVIQFISLKGHFLSEQFMRKVKENLPEFDLSIKEMYITKEQFNENIVEWSPKYYDWLENVLFSKAEVL